MVNKLVAEKFRPKTLELLKKVKDLGPVIPAILRKIGWEMGRVKRALCENKISWGFFQDHIVEWHCNAHLNNFIVSPPKMVEQK